PSLPEGECGCGFGAVEVDMEGREQMVDRVAVVNAGLDHEGPGRISDAEQQLLVDVAGARAEYVCMSRDVVKAAVLQQPAQPPADGEIPSLYPIGRRECLMQPIPCRVRRVTHPIRTIRLLERNSAA